MTAGGAAGASREPVGSAAEEAARLVEAFQGWWTGREAADGAGADPASAPDAQPRSEPSSEPPSESLDPEAGRPHPASSTCRYCPWCRALATAQAVRPEVVEHLLSAAESVAAALRELSRDVAAARDPSGDAAPHTAPTRTVTIPVEPDDAQEVD